MLEVILSPWALFSLRHLPLAELGGGRGEEKSSDYSEEQCLFTLCLQK